jgi:hypothetical protein
MANDKGDSVSLSLAGFFMAMDAHDRDAAFAAFDAALSISPSSALSYIWVRWPRVGTVKPSVQLTGPNAVCASVHSTRGDSSRIGHL